MDQQCKNCGQKESCREAFEKLGSSKTSLVLLKAVQAFLLPLVFFIAALAAAEKLLGERPASQFGRNVISLAAATVVVCLYLAVLKLWRSKH
jgi:hypothetical protein